MIKPAATENADSARARSQADGRDTLDTAFDGGLMLAQPKRGYRFNADSIHLVEFAASFGPVTNACDLGAGCGVIGLGIVHQGAASHMTLVERDPELTRCLRQNAALFRTSLTQVEELPVESFRSEATFRLIVTNPPYFTAGRTPADAARATARHGHLRPFVRCAAKHLGARGRFCVVYPAASLSTLFAELRHAQLEPKCLQFVHAKAAQDARIVMVMAQRGKPGGVVVRPPTFDE
jgi:tRNA1Val (adenine37-N6)-methyltransferase